MMNRKQIAALGGVGLASLSASVLADVPAEVTTAITDAGTDIATIGGAVLGLAVVAMTFKWLKASFF
jgi:hypothetical protein